MRTGGLSCPSSGAGVETPPEGSVVPIPLHHFPHGYVLIGNAAECMAECEPAQLVCSSPPYWAKRQYPGIPNLIFGGRAKCKHLWEKTPPPRTRPCEPSDTCSRCGAWKGQLGQQPDPEMFAQHLADIFAAVPLRKDATLFINIMDSYVAGKGKSGSPTAANGARRRAAGETLQRAASNIGEKGVASTGNDLGALRPLHLKPKDMACVPWRLAMAMQQRGFYFRDHIIWYKKNAMPEPAKDRLSNRHEQILMFSRSPKYFFDPYALGEVPVLSTQTRVARARLPNKFLRQSKAAGGKQGLYKVRKPGEQHYPNEHRKKSENIWRMATAGHRSKIGDHVAVMPMELASAPFPLARALATLSLTRSQERERPALPPRNCSGGLSARTWTSAAANFSATGMRSTRN